MSAQTWEKSAALTGTAPLRVINCTDLRNGAPNALANLFLVATVDGIFYLDLHNGDEMSMSHCIRDVDKLSRAIFDMPVEKKLAYDVDTMGNYKVNGYKPVGRNKGGIKGHRDGFESYAISRDAVEQSSKHHPDAVGDHRESLMELTSTCLDMAQIIFKALSSLYELPEGDSFQSRHDQFFHPLDLVRLLKYPSAIGNDAFSIPQLAHADMGSLTFLFTASPGLQILPAGTETWLDVPPRPGHAIVNFGDAMKILSGGQIESVLHRVVVVPGKQVQDRYSFAFLMRPGASTIMAALPRFRSDEAGEDVSPMTCEEWVSMRFSQLRAK